MSLTVFPVMFLLGATLAASLEGNVIKRFYFDSVGVNAFNLYFYNAVSFIGSAVVLCLVCDIAAVSVFTFFAAVLFGMVTALQQIFFMTAVGKGPLSYTSVLVSLSTFIPALSGAIFWQESVSAVQIAGMVLLVFCFFASSNGKSGQKPRRGWLSSCLTAFLLTGAIGVMQKWQQSSPYQSQSAEFLIIAFIVAFAVSLVALGFTAHKGGNNAGNATFSSSLIINAPEKRKSAFDFATIAAVLAGASAAVNNFINLYLSGAMDSAVFFPVVNGGGLMLVTVYSVIFFREKLSPKQWTGLVLGCVAVVLLCNPFA